MISKAGAACNSFSEVSVCCCAAQKRGWEGSAVIMLGSTLNSFSSIRVNVPPFLDLVSSLAALWSSVPLNESLSVRETSPGYYTRWLLNFCIASSVWSADSIIATNSYPAL